MTRPQSCKKITPNINAIAMRERQRIHKDTHKSISPTVGRCLSEHCLRRFLCLSTPRRNKWWERKEEKLEERNRDNRASIQMGGCLERDSNLFNTGPQPKKNSRYLKLEQVFITKFGAQTKEQKSKCLVDHQHDRQDKERFFLSPFSTGKRDKSPSAYFWKR